MWEWELAGKQLGEMLGWLLYCCARCEASCICAKHKYQTQSGCLFHSHFAWLWVMGWRPVTERVYGLEMCHMDPKQIDFVALWHHRHHPDTVPPGPWDGGWVCSTAPVTPYSGFWLRPPIHAQPGAATPPEALPNREHPIMWAFWVLQKSVITCCNWNGEICCSSYNSRSVNVFEC